MANLLQLRDASVNSASRLSDLAFRSKAFWGYSDQFMERCREELHVPKKQFGHEIIREARVNGHLAGFYRLICSRVDEPAELEAMFVDPIWIGKGIGKYLFADCEASARKSSAIILRADADPNAEPFYIKMGMIRTGFAPSGSIAGRSLPVLEKRLIRLESE